MHQRFVVPIACAVLPKSIWTYPPKDALQVGQTIGIVDSHPRHWRGSHETTKVPKRFVVPIAYAVLPKSIWTYPPKDALQVGQTIRIDDSHPRHWRGSHVTTKVPKRFVVPIAGAVLPKSILTYPPKDALRVGRTIGIDDSHPRHRRGSHVTTTVPKRFVVPIAGAVLRLINCKLNTRTAKNITDNKHNNTTIPLPKLIYYLPLLTFVDIWTTTYILPTLSCKRSLWTTPWQKYMAKIKKKVGFNLHNPRFWVLILKCSSCNAVFL